MHQFTISPLEPPRDQNNVDGIHEEPTMVTFTNQLQILPIVTNILRLFCLFGTKYNRDLICAT